MIGILRRFEDAVLATLVLALILLSAGQILFRSLFDIACMWTDPLIRHLVLWSALLGAVVAAREHKHIRIDALLRVSRPVQRDWSLLLSEVFSTVTCGALSWISLEFILNERSYGTTGLLDIPTWVLQLIFPVAFGAMTCRFGSRAWRRAGSLIRGPSAA